MVHNQISEQDVPVYDDGWWASVLAEEESRTVQPVDKFPKA